MNRLRLSDRIFRSFIIFLKPSLHKGRLFWCIREFVLRTAGDVGPYIFRAGMETRPYIICGTSASAVPYKGCVYLQAWSHALRMNYLAIY